MTAFQHYARILAGLNYDGRTKPGTGKGRHHSRIPDKRELRARRKRLESAGVTNPIEVMAELYGSTVAAIKKRME